MTRSLHTLSTAIVLAMLVQVACASDHADPIKLKRLEAGITGLFAFLHDDQMVVILGVRRALTQSPPYDLEPNTYRIHMDLGSAVSFASEEDRARYGGTVVKPAAIRPDVTIQIKLTNDATLREKSIQGLRDVNRIRTWTGIRDDPFIFPRFFGTNIVAIVLSLPISSFPEGQQDWLIWAISRRGDKQIDHVGRSNRTMLPRFDFLNTLPPHEHVAALNRRHNDPDLIQDVARNVLMPLFALRQYDFAPDVMILTNRYPAGFPNGRLLRDDVAALTCEQGDCLLWELSMADSESWPRQTFNDKPFLDEFPYLADPWPDSEPSPTPGLTTRNKTILVIIVTIVVLLLLLPWALYIRRLRHI